MIFFSMQKYNGNMQNQTDSVLTVEQQKKISLTGVESVDAFSDTEIRLCVAGKKMLITGTGLKVLSFSKGSGAFAAIGEVSLIRYGANKGKFLQRLFK